MQNYDTFATNAIAFKLPLALSLTWIFFWAAADISCQNLMEDPVIVLDPGHGGKDHGAGNHLCSEKSICLAICQMAREKLTVSLPKAKIYLTREEDSFVPLKKRSSFANELDADLFISLHCNAFGGHPRAARGTETYVMGLHKTEDNLEVAKRENLSVLFEDESEDLEEMNTESLIFLNHLQDRNLQRSIEFAKLMEDEFSNNHPGKSKGVKQAGFMVLHQISMPGVLVEAGFLSHPDECRYLCSYEGQMTIANQLVNAIHKYFKVSPQRELIAQTINNTTSSLPQNEAVYKVQLITSPLDPGNDAQWSTNKSVEIVFESGLYKVYSGNYHDKQQALSEQDKWIQAGFKEAFVVSFPSSN
ncbi:MAG: N-acetylmuramoyl-L-alanine amidase [Saprospiraceae bacterium]|nr:N-acetylmuramoyl-L-alanine amidase [Saprospiraceae bacterium]